MYVADIALRQWGAIRACQVCTPDRDGAVAACHTQRSASGHLATILAGPVMTRHELIAALRDHTCGEISCEQCNADRKAAADMLDYEATDTVMTPEQRTDEALDAVLSASGSALKHYTTPRMLSAMREAMRCVMSKSYIAGSDAAIAALVEGNDWQAIETAPMDGTQLQLLRRDCQVVGYYGGANSGWRINAPGYPPMWPLPTHWAPLRNSPD